MLLCLEDDYESPDEQNEKKKRDKDRRYQWNHGSESFHTHIIAFTQTHYLKKTISLNGDERADNPHNNVRLLRAHIVQNTNKYTLYNIHVRSTCPLIARIYS